MGQNIATSKHGYTLSSGLSTNTAKKTIYMNQIKKQQPFMN